MIGIERVLLALWCATASWFGRRQVILRLVDRRVTSWHRRCSSDLDSIFWYVDRLRLRLPRLKERSLQVVLSLPIPISIGEKSPMHVSRVSRPGNVLRRFLGKRVDSAFSDSGRQSLAVGRQGAFVIRFQDSGVL
jgi:hypothetical protein